jgi:hypothetical protein
MNWLVEGKERKYEGDWWNGLEHGYGTYAPGQTDEVIVEIGRTASRVGTGY